MVETKPALPKLEHNNLTEYCSAANLLPPTSELILKFTNEYLGLFEKIQKAKDSLKAQLTQEIEKFARVLGTIFQVLIMLRIQINELFRLENITNFNSPRAFVVGNLMFD